MKSIPKNPAHRMVFTGDQVLIPELGMVGADRWRSAVNALESHVHPDAWEICYVLRGSVDWWVENELVEVHGNGVYLTRPGERHGGVDAMMHPCELLWLQVTIPATGSLPGLSLPETRLLRQSMNDITLRTFPGSPEVADCIRKILSAHTRRDQFAALSARSALHELLITLLNLHARQAQSLADNHAASPRLQRAIDWMQEHLVENFAIDDAAEVAGLGLSQFHDLFLKHTGFTPADYRQHQRVHRAKKLLRDSHKSITSIGHELGFSTSQYFATVFRKIVGLTPRQYAGRLKSTLEHQE